MKVIDTYGQNGYIYFVLESGEIKSFPSYWAFSFWLGASDHEELQLFLKQAIEKTWNCPICLLEIKARFPDKNKTMCMNCELQKQIDDDIFYMMESINK